MQLPWRSPLVLETGARLGRFQIVSPLGAGGMGEVYRAHDTRLGRDVAIKLLPETIASHPERRARLEREARALASLAHSGIATLHEIVEGEGQLALVMELVEGEDLAGRLARQPLSVPQALDIAGQIAAALDHAHQRGILHRDLKPSNVVLGGEGRVKLLDFGLAKMVAPVDDLSTGETATTPATEAGVVLGSAPYMSPEQARGQDLDRRTDVWAFGCVLYELLSGRRAFPGNTRADTIAAVLGSEPAWHLLPVGTPASVRKLLRRCLQKDKAERLRDMGDAGFELKDALSETGADFRPTPRPFRLPAGPWRTGIHWIAGLTALLVIGLATRRAVAPTTPGEGIRQGPATLSPASSTAEATATPVRIRHEPIGCMVAGQHPIIDAMIEPVEAVARARVYFRSALGREYYFVDMARVGRTFVGKLPKPSVAASPVTYYVAAYTGARDALVESGRTPEASVVVVAAPLARSASDPAARATCPSGEPIASFGPPGAVTVYSAGGADLVLSLKDAFGLEDLVAALKDSDARVREEAANSLGAIGPETTRAIADAVARLSNRDPELRERAASDLAETGRRVTRQVMTALVEALEDPDTRVCEAAAHALGEIGPGVASAVVALRQLLKDPDAQVRKSATEALGSIGTALSPAIAALEHEWSEGGGASGKAAHAALDKIQAALSATSASPAPGASPR